MRSLPLAAIAAVALLPGAWGGMASGAAPGDGSAPPAAVSTPPAPAVSTPPAPTVPAELAPLSFLLGKWQAGTNTGTLGQGSGWCSFERGLRDRVIVRTNHAEYPASEKRAAAAHDDLMVIYVAGGAVEARYFDSEGNLIHYSVSSPESGQAVFLGDAAPDAPRYRLTYKLRGDGVLEGTFEVAPPGKPEEFARFLSWESHR